MPYPELHSFAASMLKRIRRYRKYLARKLINSNSEPDVELVLHGVSGYNVIRYFHKFYAIPQSEGAFLPDKARSGGYTSNYSGNTAAKVLQKIDNATKQKLQIAQNNDDSMSPQLVTEGFLGFNIISVGGEFHAILQSDGAFEYDKLLSKGYSQSFSGTSLSEVQDAISRSANDRESVDFRLKSTDDRAGV